MSATRKRGAKDEGLYLLQVKIPMDLRNKLVIYQAHMTVAGGTGKQATLSEAVSQLLRKAFGEKD